MGEKTTTEACLTPSLPQPGWMMHGRACKQHIFRSCDIYFQCSALWSKSFHMPVRKRKPKGLKVSNLALLWVVFKWHHGSERVNSWFKKKKSVASPLHSSSGTRQRPRTSGRGLDLSDPVSVTAGGRDDAFRQPAGALWSCFRRGQSEHELHTGVPADVKDWGGARTDQNDGRLKSM